MNNLKKQLILSCAAIGFTSFALLASAHEHHGNNCKDQENKAECRHAQMTKFKAMREAKWHDELKITAAQEPAWKAFTESFPKQGTTHSNHDEKLSRADAEKVPAPQRLEKHLTRMGERQTAMQAHLPALKTLYAELTPEQQTLLNKRLAQLEQKNRRHHQHHGDHRFKHKHDHSPVKTEPTAKSQ